MLFSEHSGLVLSAGYVLVMCVCLPMGLLNLDDNMYVQVFSSFILVGVTGCFGWQFVHKGLQLSTLPLIGAESGSVAGVVMFSFASVVSVPSWANEKKPDCSTTQTVRAVPLHRCAAVLLRADGWNGAGRGADLDIDCD
jgi:hypothetical protein